MENYSAILLCICRYWHRAVVTYLAVKAKKMIKCKYIFFYFFYIWGCKKRNALIKVENKEKHIFITYLYFIMLSYGLNWTQDKNDQRFILESDLAAKIEENKVNYWVANYCTAWIIKPMSAQYIDSVEKTALRLLLGALNGCKTSI